MLHDEEVFPDADKFDPERFIKDGIIRDDILNPEVVATFGFGRRFAHQSPRNSAVDIHLNHQDMSRFANRIVIGVYHGLVYFGFVRYLTGT